MIIRLRIPAERDAPRCEASDGEQEIGGLRRIGTTGGELRRAFRRDEAGVAVLPSVELAVEKGTALPVIRQGRQVVVDARDEAACAVGGEGGVAGAPLGPGVSAPSCSPTALCGLRDMATLCSSSCQLRFVVAPGLV